MKTKLNLSQISFLVILILMIFNIQSAHAQMFWNHAASFAGNSSSYIKCRNSTSLNLTGSFTLEAWINPGTLSGFSKGIISKGGAFGTSLIYGMRLEATGRIVLSTNGTARLRTKTTTLIPVNKWSHIAGTYNSSSGLFSLYVNGVLDSSAIVAGAAPASNTDTLYFGISGSTTPFTGMMDEIRIWNREVPGLYIYDNMRTSISAVGGIYDGMVMSLPFQIPYYSNVSQFNVSDWSAFFNTCINNGVSDADLSDVPSNTICINQAAQFGGLDDYAAGADNLYVSPTNRATLQAWIFPRSNADAVIIHKGTPNGATTNYSLNIINKKLAAKINGVVFNSGDTVKLNQWSHVAFNYLYSGTTTTSNFYVNGKNVKNNFTFGGANIADGTDSLYIGGTIGLADFNGLIDEVRISRYFKTLPDILDSMFVPMEINVSQLLTSAAYNFDGSSSSNTSLGPKLFFRNNALMIAMFSPLSPLNKAYSLDFQKAFCLKLSPLRIPETGGTGSTMDSMNIFLDENISDINLFVALDHDNSSNLEADLIAPDGTSVRFLDNNSLLNSNESVVTVFDDNAPTSLTNLTFTSYGPKIKPLNNMNSVFAGKNTKGFWKLKITDTQSADSGRLNAWGIQFNNRTSLPKVVSCKTLIEGFYNSASNTMIRDTMTAYLRNYLSPYNKIDSSKSYLQSDGSGSFVFTNPGINSSQIFYLQVQHRNSIETWSTNLVGFPSLTSQDSYDFTADSSKAFGSNVVRADNSPVRFAIYSGDINQDGSVDLSDLTLAYNDAGNFASGYIMTDVNGDNLADLNDLIIIYNNSSSFVSVVRP